MCIFASFLFQFLFCLLSFPNYLLTSSSIVISGEISRRREGGREEKKRREMEGIHGTEKRHGERRGRHRGRAGKRQSERYKEIYTGKVKRGDKGKGKRKKGR